MLPPLWVSRGRVRAGEHDNGLPGLWPVYGPDYYAAFIIDPGGDTGSKRITALAKGED